MEDHAAFCNQGCCCLWLCLESMQMLCPCSELYCTLWEVLVTDRGPGLEQYLPLRRGDCCFSPKGELCWNWSWCPLVILSVVQLFLRFMPRGNEFAVFQRRMYHRDRYFGNSCHRITVFWGGRDMGNVFKTIFSFFHTEGGEALEQVAQGGCGCPIPAGIQSQAGCGSGQPGLVVGDPAHSRGVETWWSLWSFSAQAILWFYDSLCDSYLSIAEQYQ